MKRLQLAVSQSDGTRLDSGLALPEQAHDSLKAWFTSSDNKLLLNQLRLAGLRCCQEDPAAGQMVPQAPAAQGQAAAAGGAGGGGGEAAGGVTPGIAGMWFLCC